MTTIRKLSPELAKIAEKELNESEARLKAGIKLLKEWLKLLPYIKEPLDDQWLAAFLRGCKFSLERAQEKLEKFYTVRTIIPEFFKNRDPTVSPLKDLIHKGCFLPLENKTNPTGPSISLFRGDYDPSKYSMNDILKYNFLLWDVRLYEDDGMNVAGMIDICDLKYITIKHMTAFTPTVSKKGMRSFSEAYPLRLKGTHFVNIPMGFETAFQILKMFMPDKLKSRVHVHQNFESLYEYIPQENLPKEYGGQAGTIDELTEKWIAKIESRKDFLIDSEKYCTDESLRPDGPITPDAEFSSCSVM